VEDYAWLRNDSLFCKDAHRRGIPRSGCRRYPPPPCHAPPNAVRDTGFTKTVRGRTCTASPLSLIPRREPNRQNVHGLVRVLVYFVASFCGWASGIMFHVSAWNFQSDPSRATTDKKVPVMCVGAPPFDQEYQRSRSRHYNPHPGRLSYPQLL
jgi:hypothetical protein